MKKLLLILLLVFSLSACTKPQETEKTNEVVGVVKKIDLSEDDINTMIQDYRVKFKNDFNNAKLVKVDLYDDSYVYAKVNVYTYIDNEWKENGSAIFDDEFKLNYLLMDFDINLHDEKHINDLKFLSLDDDKEINSAFSFIVDNPNFKDDGLISYESFIDDEIKLYKDRETILYETTKSNGDDKFSSIKSLYFDEFLTHKDLGYGSGIIVTLKLSDEKPEEISSDIIVNDTESFREYVALRGVDYLDWKDFEHLEHKDVGSGMIVGIYELEDAKLKLIGKSYDEKPSKIILIQNSKDIIFKDFNE